jgi:tetratricopeptide (TPR) repeat protein
MKKVLPLLFLVVAPATQAADDQARYAQCMSQVSNNPQAALATANLWKPDEGGTAAAHCLAAALVGVKRYAEGAAKLDALARAKDIPDIGMRAELLDQAGNAWLLAGNPKSADASFSSALTLNPRDADIFADAARAKAALKDWKGAQAHLTAALALNPRRADLLVLRASARHALGQKVEARADLERALDLKPGMPDALVERGSMKREAGDVTGARADWEAATRSPGEAADAARKLLSALP